MEIYVASELQVATSLPSHPHMYIHNHKHKHSPTYLCSTFIYLLRFLGQTKVAMMMLIITSSFTSPAVQKSLGEFPFSTHTHTEALT